MKKLMLVTLLTICWGNAFAQIEPIEFDDNGGFSRVIEVKATAIQAFQYCRTFLSNKIKDYQRAVQIEDANTNKIQINYKFEFLEDAQSSSSSIKAYFDAYETAKLSVDCKDNKIRIMVESPFYNYKLYAANMLINSRNNEEYWLFNGLVLDKKHFKTTRSNEYLWIILGMKQYIEQQVKNEDW